MNTSETCKKEMASAKMLDEILRDINIVDEKSKLISELSEIAKGLIFQKPEALDGNIAEYFIKKHLGDASYIKIRKVYRDIIGA